MSQVAPAAQVRKWARDNGLAVGDRGRIAPELHAAYAAAQHRSLETVEQALTGIVEDIEAVLPNRPAKTNTPTAEIELRISARPKPGAIGHSRTVSARTS